MFRNVDIYSISPTIDLQDILQSFFSLGHYIYSYYYKLRVTKAGVNKSLEALSEKLWKFLTMREKIKVSISTLGGP